MRRWEHWSFNALHAIVAASGLAYLYMKYLLVAGDPFAVINHPWQPAVLSAHVVAAPVFVAFFGMLLRSHTLGKLTSPIPANRRSGWFALVSFSAMALSGYLLQVASSPEWIAALLWLHTGTGLLFVAGYGLHLVISWHLGRLVTQAIQIRHGLPQPDRLHS